MARRTGPGWRHMQLRLRRLTSTHDLRSTSVHVLHLSNHTPKAGLVRTLSWFSRLCWKVSHHQTQPALGVGHRVLSKSCPSESSVQGWWLP